MESTVQVQQLSKCTELLSNTQMFLNKGKGKNTIKLINFQCFFILSPVFNFNKTVTDSNVGKGQL